MMLPKIKKLKSIFKQANSEYIFLFALLIFVGFLMYSTVSDSQPVDPEEISLSTVYPAPFGEYNELMVKEISDYDDPNNYGVDPTGRSNMHQIYLRDRDEDLSGGIDDDEHGDLFVEGRIYGDEANVDEFYVDLNLANDYSATDWGDPNAVTTKDAQVYIESLRTKSFIQMGAVTPGNTNPPFAGKQVYDLAEGMQAEGCEGGDVVIISPDKDALLIPSSKKFTTNIAGVVSECPKLYMGATKGNTPLALAGIVRCKVTIENGPIKRGDLLVSASAPGHAMRAESSEIKAGMLIGKALQTLEEGQGKIYILVNKQ
ncbi:MAG: hypothetical protein GY853_02765 [PVC group bacterium]|nr:hypothetical protein [PVC group bacterium]